MKRITIASVLLIALPLALMAQTPKKAAQKAKRLAPSQVEIKSTAVQMASGIRAAEAALSPAEMAIAELIYQGSMPCELGATVTVTADAKVPGFFDLKIKNLRFRMSPVVTSTGAIRLEDQQAGAVWLQLSNKSMLMNQKLGQRLADVCMNPEQVTVAELLIKSPAPGLLDAPMVVAQKPTPPAAAPTAAPSLPEVPVAVAPGTPSAAASIAVPVLPAVPVAVAPDSTPPGAAPAAVPGPLAAPVAVAPDAMPPAAALIAVPSLLAAPVAVAPDSTQPAAAPAAVPGPPAAPVAVAPDAMAPTVTPDSATKPTVAPLENAIK